MQMSCLFLVFSYKIAIMLMINKYNRMITKTKALLLSNFFLQKHNSEFFVIKLLPLYIHVDMYGFRYQIHLCIMLHALENVWVFFSTYYQCKKFLSSRNFLCNAKSPQTFFYFGCELKPEGIWERFKTEKRFCE